jgi:DNA (cytosine-5)-methyltransferase 1
MRVLDLFSGIGGFSLGLERAGMRTVAFCEVDKFCQQVLKKHWPDVPIHDDITQLDGKQYAGAIDLVCGGFPCQPFSVAGKQKGKNDNRYLWPEMLRIVSEAKPTWFIGENVPGIINMALEQVCVDLEAQGYEVQTLIIPACAVDAPHRRNRIWIVAYSKYNGWNATEKYRSNGENVCGPKERQNSTKQSKGIYSSTFMANPNIGSSNSRNEPAGRKEGGKH